MESRYPRLDRSGLSQNNFGIRGTDSSFPDGAHDWQTEGVDQGQPRLTYGFRCYPQIDHIKRLPIGSLLFIEKKPDTLIDRIWSLHLLSYQTHCAAQNTSRGRGQDLCELPNQNKRKFFETTPTNPPQKSEFLSTIQSFRDNVRFGGVTYGTPTPYATSGPLMSDRSALSSRLQVIPTVIMGNCFFPNYFDCDLRNGQELFMIIKQVHVSKASKFKSPEGDLMNNSKMNYLVTDFIFYTNPMNVPPKRIDYKFLKEYHEKKQSGNLDLVNQPDRFCRNFVDDQGEMTDGIVYSLGTVIHTYLHKASTPIGHNTKGTFQKPKPNMIEVSLNIQEIL